VSIYYNTTNATNPELTDYKAVATGQDEIILELFTYGNRSGYTPSQVWRIVLRKSLLTSVRRSITNLTDIAKLVKTDAKREGFYGRPEHVWRLATGGDPSQGSLGL